MKTIVVTGARGVVGRAVLEKAAARGDIEILALSRRSAKTAGSPGCSKWVATDYSENSLNELFQGVSAVIHLAGIKGDKTDPADFKDDLKMTENVFRAAGNRSVRTVLYASSRLVYVNPDNIPWTEDTVPEPCTAYGYNKIKCEELCRIYSNIYGYRAAAVRIAQVLSEADHMRNMVNVFRDTASQHRQITVIGRSIAKRQYIYSRDLAEVLLRLTDADINGFTIVNAGMENAYTNLEIAEAFNRAYGNEVPVNYDDSAPETITSSIMDVSRMKGLTGYIPQDLDHALADMAARQ